MTEKSMRCLLFLLTLLAPSAALAQGDANDAAKIVEIIRMGGVVRALVFILIAAGLLWFLRRAVNRLGERFTGRRLLFDGATETFPGNDEANRYLGREYRKGFELPPV